MTDEPTGREELEPARSPAGPVQSPAAPSTGWWQDRAGNWREGPRPSGVAVSAAAADHGQPCPVCGRVWGAGIACQFCGQIEGAPAGVHLSSPGRRLGAYVLEGVLVVVTLFVGWLVWALIVFGRGQTPAKQLLGMRAIKLRTGMKAGWGTMFLREFVAKLIIGFLAWFTLGIVYFWLIWDKNNQELWDKIVDTVIVNDPNKQLA
jgi:RDD family